MLHFGGVHDFKLLIWVMGDFQHQDLRHRCDGKNPARIGEASSHCWQGLIHFGWLLGDSPSKCSFLSPINGDDPNY